MTNTQIIWSILGVMGLALFLGVSVWFVSLFTNTKRSTSRTAPGATTPATTPPTPKFWNTGKVVRLVLVAGAIAFVWFALEDTVLGKALYKAGRSTVGDDWLPYLVLYLPTAILAWIAYRIAFGKSLGIGGIGISPTTIIVTLILAAGALGVAHMMRPIESAPATTEVKFNPRTVGSETIIMMGPQTEVWVYLQAAKPGTSPYWGCPEAVGVVASELKKPLRFNIVGGSGTYVNRMRLDHRSQMALHGLRTQSVDVRFVLRQGNTNPCSFVD